MAGLGISSQSIGLLHAGGFFAAGFLFFGFNAMFRPRAGLEIFEFERPKDAEAQKLVDGLVILYGARDVYMGATVAIAWYLANRTILGWSLVVGSGVVFVDGIVNNMVIGRGQWKHWGDAPVMGAVGAALLGLADHL